MTKDEYIAEYGEDAYQRILESSRKWCKTHVKQLTKRKLSWVKEHKEQNITTTRKWRKNRRQKGLTEFCRENYDLIENYELAKLDNFDSNKWHLHHRLENYYSSETLRRKGLYYNLNPEALIWLPEKEHAADYCKSGHHPELSKWHQRSLERE